MDHQFNRWIKLLLALVLIVGSLLFLFAIGDLVQLIIISALLTYILDPMVTEIESRGAGRVTATLILFGALGTVFSILFITLLPIISVEIQGLQEGFSIDKTRALVERLEATLESKLAFLNIPDLNLTDKISEMLVSLGNELLSNLMGIFSLLTNFILLPFIVFFLLKDWRDIKKRIISLVPNRYFEFTLNLLYKIDLQLGNYLRGQTLDAFIIGILSTGALILLGVKHALLIGAFAGLANLIPYVGPFCGAIVAILVNLIETGDLGSIFYIAMAFGVVQLLDNAVVQPAVIARTVNLPPLMVLFGVIIGGKFFGILGMLLSVPVVATIKVTVQESIKIFRKYRFT